MNLDQKAVIEVVLGVLIPVLVAVLGAFGWSPVAKVWLKFAFSVIGAVAVAFFMGQFAGVTLPPLSDPVALLGYLGGIVSVVFTLTILIYQMIGERVTNSVVRFRVQRAAAK